jgi:hypothetical protein
MLDKKAHQRDGYGIVCVRVVPLGSAQAYASKQVEPVNRSGNTARFLKSGTAAENVTNPFSMGGRGAVTRIRNYKPFGGGIYPARGLSPALRGTAFENSRQFRCQRGLPQG